MLTLLSTLALAALLPWTRAAQHTVEIAPSGKLIFQPDTVTAALGDTVLFRWKSDGHSVTQSKLETPCASFEGAIYSSTLDTSKQFTVTLNDTDAIWIFCNVPGHCQAGMAMVINPPNGQDIAGYKSAAANAAPSSFEPVVDGGIVAAAGTSLGGSSSSLFPSSAASRSATASSASVSANASGTSNSSSGGAYGTSGGISGISEVKASLAAVLGLVAIFAYELA